MPFQWNVAVFILNNKKTYVPPSRYDFSDVVYICCEGWAIMLSNSQVKINNRAQTII